MSEWQPIETAPKDGTLILVYRPKGEPNRHYVGQIGTDAFGVVKSYPNEWGQSSAEVQPTHWMPLPDPPK